MAGYPLPPVETVPKDQLGGHFNFTQPIYEGEYFPLKRKAHQIIEGALEHYGKAVQDILFNVAQVYYEVLKARDLKNIAREIVKLNEEAFRVAKVRFDSGDVTEDVPLKAELDLAQAQNIVIKNTNQLKLTEDLLKRLIGVESKDFDLVEPLEKSRINISYDEFVKIALANRYDYKMALMNIQVAETNIAVAKSRFHPSFRGTWDYYKIDDPAFLEGDDYWIAEVRLVLPIFDGGMKYLNLKEEKENLKQARLELEELKNDIMNQVENAFLAEATDYSILQNLEKKIYLAVKNHKIILSKFMAGAAIILELNQAIALLDSAKTEIITNKYDYQMQLLMLERVTGIFAKDHVDKALSALQEM